jgi:hypothetical protein
MAPFTSMRRGLAQGAAAVGLVLLLGQGGLSAHAAPANRMVSAVSTWMGHPAANARRRVHVAGTLTFIRQGEHGASRHR